MPLIPGKSPAVVSKNISEFHKGPTFEHTAEKFGKIRANKQAVAVALHSADKSKHGDKPEDHKAAVSKMNPEHVHKLVQDAHAGKYGPQAQQIAQQATEPQGDNNSDGIAGDSTTTPGGPNRSAIFTSGPNAPADGDSDDMAQPVNRAAMFSSSRGR